MINIPTDMPTMAELKEFTLPRYSGARNRESAPKVFINVPFTVLNKINQNTNSTWYFLKCRKNNWMGKEYKKPFSQVFMQIVDGYNKITQ